MIPPGLVISAPASGTGKTTVTLGLLRALAQDSVQIQPFKCGPDYIDPAFHRAACGRASFNLDSWTMDAGTINRIAACPADIALAEGAMGLFDGAMTHGALGHGTSADIARHMGWPVILVLDIAGQAQSVAAVAQGFTHFDPSVQVAGVILNRVGSMRHERLARAALAAADIPLFGALHRDTALHLPERHLGLVQAQEHAALDDAIAIMAARLREGVDLTAIRAAARGGRAQPPARWPAPPAQRIAIAQDAAFSFLYPHQLDAWRHAGAQILPFSPLADEAPDADADLVWLPGGYPELHAGRIAAAEHFMAGLRRHAATRPVHGECGGYMVLGAAIVDHDGTEHAMAGLLGLVTSHAERRLHLGYRQAELRAPLPGLPIGTRLLGHEFHYSTILAQPDPPLMNVADADGASVTESGSYRGHVSGSFFHLIASMP